MSTAWIRPFETLTNDDVASVGGKNASLGEMTQALAGEGIPVPPGFAVTADAYRAFLDAGGLVDVIAARLRERAEGRCSLAEAGAAIRARILAAALPDALAEAVRRAYRDLGERVGVARPDVAVRSSATAEDLPEASFAGQQESFLNVRGDAALLDACRRCYASLYTDRAIAYREAHGYDHLQVALSVGVQQMVRSDRAGAGVAFTIDPETGFPDVVLINAAWGLGESVVKGVVTPDQYTVYKPFLADAARRPILDKQRGDKALKLVYADDAPRPAEPALARWDDDGGYEPLAAPGTAPPAAPGTAPPAAPAAPDSVGAGSAATTAYVDTSDEERRTYVLDDDEVLQLARWAARIEAHYGRPMDIEWAKDGPSGRCFIVQARPETVQARREATALRTYRMKTSGDVLVTGLAIGDAIAAGPVCVIRDAADRARFVDGAVLVTDTTDPDWVPFMRRASGIVTDRGGRTSHAAIVSRELGVPAVVGTGEATRTLREGQEVTLSCAEGDRGVVYDGRLAFEEEEIDLGAVPETRTRIMLNIASPAAAWRWWRLPCRGIGLARMEYLVNNVIKIHPMALVRYATLGDAAVRAEIDALTEGYDDKPAYFVDVLARGIASMAATQYPEPVIVRTSDFKTNEYAHLVGGGAFEPDEANPMLGWRGASRYYADAYREGFALECGALRRVRDEMGFTNVVVMIPFCRTPAEADRVLAEMARHGLRRGDNGLQVYVMAEIPSNVVLAARFAERFDGFSIGSNDLTQLVLGVDRDSSELAYLFDERDEAVTIMIRDLVHRAHDARRPVGICGQAPSDHPEFAGFLVGCGIDSISVLPDSVIGTLQRVAEAERLRAGGDGPVPAGLPTIPPG